MQSEKLFKEAEEKWNEAQDTFLKEADKLNVSVEFPMLYQSAYALLSNAYTYLREGVLEKIDGLIKKWDEKAKVTPTSIRNEYEDGYRIGIDDCNLDLQELKKSIQGVADEN